MPEIRSLISDARYRELMDRFGGAPEPDEDDDPPRKLTRNERLQKLADSGCDTWEEYRGGR